MICPRTHNVFWQSQNQNLGLWLPCRLFLLPLGERKGERQTVNSWRVGILPMWFSLPSEHYLLTQRNSHRFQMFKRIMGTGLKFFTVSLDSDCHSKKGPQNTLTPLSASSWEKWGPLKSDFYVPKVKQWVRSQAPLTYSTSCPQLLTKIPVNLSKLPLYPQLPKASWVPWPGRIEIGEVYKACLPEMVSCKARGLSEGKHTSLHPSPWGSLLPTDNCCPWPDFSYCPLQKIISSFYLCEVTKKEVKKKKGQVLIHSTT